MLIKQTMPPTTKVLTIGDLEAGFPSYCQALRQLVTMGRDLESIRRTLCWDYLQRLQQSYRSPEELVQRYQRSLATANAPCQQV